MSSLILKLRYISLSEFMVHYNPKEQKLIMCISLALKKYRTSNCTHLINETFRNFCFPPGEETHFPWYIPLIDVDNEKHYVFYNDSYEEDVSNQTFPSDLWIMAPTNEIILKVSIFIPLVILGVFGNVSLLYVIFKYRHLWTATNMVIANMAIVDLLSLVMYPWIYLITDLFQNYQLGEIGCKTEGWLECTLLLVNVMNLSTISYDRLTAIVLPYETRLTRKRAKIVIFLAWSIAFLLSCPLIIYRQYKKRQWRNFLEIYCTENAKQLAIYWHILLAMIVWLPLVIMAICYTAIFIKLDYYEQKVQRREHPYSVSYKTKVAKVLFIIVITFIICRTPFTALIFKRNQWLKVNKMNQVNGANKILWFSARYLIYANAAIDPLIYGLTNENFRKALKKTAFIKFFFNKKKENNFRKSSRIINVIEPRSPYIMHASVSSNLKLMESSNTKKELF